MFYVALALFIVGAVLLAIGYRKNNRDMLLLGAFLFLSSGSLADFGKGFVEGFKAQQPGAAVVDAE